VDSPIHAGASIELFSKLVLAQLDRRLIRPATDAPHALLDAIGELQNRPITPRKSARYARTVDASVALALVCRFYAGVQEHEHAAQQVLGKRNAAAHLAVPDSNVAETLAALDLFAAACLKQLGQEDAALITADRLREAGERRERELVAVKAAGLSKVEEAGTRYRTFTDGLNDEQRAQMSAMLADRTTHHPGDDGWFVECPV